MMSCITTHEISIDRGEIPARYVGTSCLGNEGGARRIGSFDTMTFVSKHRVESCWQEHLRTLINPVDLGGMALQVRCIA